MKILRHEKGRHGIPDCHWYDLISIGNDDYTAIVMALRLATQYYKANGWTNPDEEIGKTYADMMSVLERLTDYKNHKMILHE